MPLLKLKAGHPTAFRRTLETGTGKKLKEETLLFKPGECVEVTKEQLSLLAKEVDCGLLVDPAGEKATHWGRTSGESSTNPEKDAEIAALKQRVAELEGSLAEAESLLDEVAAEDEADEEPAGDE